MKDRYLHFNKWLKDKFGERTLKICLDGGFTCPNRDGTLGKGGCIFCGERGSGENTTRSSIKEQVEKHLGGYKGQRANKFIAYFQNFSNTYAGIEELKQKYDSALISDKIVALAVATRPDCISEDVAKLLASYSNRYYVYVELGLQTTNDSTGKLINRKYTTNQFINAVNILKKYNIDIVVHIMVGLPNESEEDIKNTVKLINNINPMGVKIHSTYIIKETKLCEMYLNKVYTPLTMEQYVNSVTNIISWLSPTIVICRISGDAPKELLVSPEWNLHKKLVINSINANLEKQNIYQGCLKL